MELETRCQYKINGAHLQHLSNGILDLDDVCLAAVLKSANDDPPWTPRATTSIFVLSRASLPDLCFFVIWSAVHLVEDAHRVIGVMHVH